jgi:hypothetical protein
MGLSTQIHLKWLHVWQISPENLSEWKTGGRMSSAFAGTLLLPGEDGPGLDAVLETIEDEITLTAGTEQLGSWSQGECVVTSVGEGSFKVVLGGEMVLFTPETPSQFAAALTVPSDDDAVTATPLAARIAAQGGQPSDQKAKQEKIMPLISVAKGDEVFGRTVVTMIIAVSAVLIVALMVLTRGF